MGNDNKKIQSKLIDKQLQNDLDKSNKEDKLLLLGNFLISLQP